MLPSISAVGKGIDSLHIMSNFMRCARNGHSKRCCLMLPLLMATRTQPHLRTGSGCRRGKAKQESSPAGIRAPPRHLTWVLLHEGDPRQVIHWPHMFRLGPPQPGRQLASPALLVKLVGFRFRLWAFAYRVPYLPLQLLWSLPAWQVRGA